MYSILVVRHAQSVWNDQGRWQGQADSPLSPRGEQEARLAAAALGDVSCVVSSDLTRAEQTAKIIADALGVGPVMTDSGWREREIGPWQGLTSAEIEERDPGALASGDRPDGWESEDLLLDRSLGAMERLDKLSPADGDNILVLSHAGIIYALERYFGCSFERVSNLCGRRFLAEQQEIRLGERVALIPRPSADEGAQAQ